MDENNVVVTETVTEQTEPAKTEPAKDKPVSAEVEKLKAALSKANSEAASWKKQFREKQTEAERAEAERAEADQAMRQELETLRKEKQISDYRGKCLALKMDAQLAEQTATALADGNTDSLFNCLNAFVEATTTRLNNEALNRQPALSTGTPPSTNTVDSETAQIRRWMGMI